MLRRITTSMEERLAKPERARVSRASLTVDYHFMSMPSIDPRVVGAIDQLPHGFVSAAAAVLQPRMIKSAWT